MNVLHTAIFTAGLVTGIVVDITSIHLSSAHKVASQPPCVAQIAVTAPPSVCPEAPVADDEFVLLANKLSADGTQREVSIGRVGKNWNQGYANFAGQCKSVKLIDCN